MGQSEEKSDDNLMKDVQNGSAESFKILYDRHKKRLFNYLYHLLGNRENAEDCTQEVFIILYKKVALYSSKRKFMNWLYTIARHEAINIIRKNKVRKADSLDASPYGDDLSEKALKDRIADGQLAADKIAENEELVVLIHRAIARLQPNDREVLFLCDIQELSHDEVSGITGYSKKVIAVRLHRARTRLAEILKLEDDGLQP